MTRLRRGVVGAFGEGVLALIGVFALRAIGAGWLVIVGVAVLAGAATVVIRRRSAG